MSEKKKKILYIITQSDFGGAQRYVFDLATHFGADFDVMVAAGNDGDGELFKRLEKSSIKASQLKYLKRAINPYHDLMAFFEIKRLIKKELPDIIHLNSTKAGILGSLAKKFQVSRLPKPGNGGRARFKLQIVYTAHGWVFNEPLGWLKKKIYLWLEKFTARYKNKIICVSEYDRQIAVKNGFDAKKLITIHNGIDFENLRFLEKDIARKELFQKLSFKFPACQSLAMAGRQASSFKLIGSIANLYPTKGIEYFVHAAHMLNTKYKIQNTKYIVIGEGAERDKLENMIKKYNLADKFFLIGHLKNASQYLKAFDIFVLPSVKEGFPYVILEALSASLPIIATKVGGIPEMIISSSPLFVKGGSGGILIEPKNPRQLAEKISHLLQNKEICHNLSINARLAVRENFSLEKMINKTKKLIIS